MITDTLKQMFEAGLTVVKEENAAKVVPLLATSMTNFAGNPTIVNALAQIADFNAQVIALEPTIAQDALKAMAGTISSWATSINSSAKPAA